MDFKKYVLTLSFDTIHVRIGLPDRYAPYRTHLRAGYMLIRHENLVSRSERTMGTTMKTYAVGVERKKVGKASRE